jgi:hypothetical protein
LVDPSRRWDWPEELRRREPAALASKRATSTAAMDQFAATQFLFDHQVCLYRCSHTPLAYTLNAEPYTLNVEP